MGKQEAEIFRRRFGGYNREDVNNFIKATDIKHSKEVESLQERIENLNAKLDEADSKISTLSYDNIILKENAEVKETDSEEVKALEEKIAEKDAEISEKRIIIDNLQVELRTASEALEESKAELRNANDALAEKQAELEELKNRENDFAVITETVPVSVGNVEAKFDDAAVNANKEANAIIEEAKAKARMILENAESECNERKEACKRAIEGLISESDFKNEMLNKKISSTAGDFLSNANIDLNSSIESCMREVNACVNDIELQCKSLISRVSGRSEELNERIRYFQKYLTDGFEEKIDQIKNIYGDKSDNQ